MIKYFLLFGAACGAFTVPIAAQDEPSWDFEGYVALTTDQRDRGLKFSDSGTTLYGSLAAYHTSGFYGGLDASLINNGFRDGERTEFFAGYGFESGAYIYDAVSCTHLTLPTKRVMADSVVAVTMKTRIQRTTE